MGNKYFANPEAGNDDIWGEFSASVAVESLEALGTANLPTLSLDELWRLSFRGVKLKIFNW
jgi:hypothetical protein